MTCCNKKLKAQKREEEKKKEIDKKKHGATLSGQIVKSRASLGYKKSPTKSK